MMIVTAGISVFSVSCWIFNRPFVRVAEQSTSDGTLSPWLLAVCVIAAAFFVSETIRLAHQAGTDAAVLIAIRTAINTADSEGSNAFGALSIVPNISFATALIFLAENRHRRLTWLAIAVALLCAVLTGGRTYLFRLAAGCMFVVLLRRKDRRFLLTLRQFSIPIVVLALLLTFQVLFSKVETQGNSRALDLAFQWFFLYICGGLTGFNYVLHHQLFASTLYNGTSNDYAWVPVPTNVYSVFGFYYLRTGLLGLLVAMLLIGGIHGYIFHRAKFSTAWSVLCAVSIYPLSLTFFEDQYRLIGTYINFCILLLIYFNASRIWSRCISACRIRVASISRQA